MVLMEYSGAGGKLIHEKTESKNLVTLSLPMAKVLGRLWHRVVYGKSVGVDSGVDTR